MNARRRVEIYGKLVLVTVLLVWAASLRAVDWEAVEAREVTLFFPGQRSWESVLTASDHGGAKPFRKGTTCRQCHGGAEQSMGDRIVSGKNKKLEAEPIAGMRGWIPLSVKTAHDGQRLYVRLQWPQSDGGSPAPAATAKASVMLGDERTAEALRGGCWAVCHDDMAGMPSADAAQPLTKYLPASRTKLTRQGGGGNYKPRAALDELLGAGAFYEYWHARLNPGAKPEALDGYVLEKRVEHATPRVEVESDLKDGTWTVVFSRDLSAGEGRKDLVPGRTYFVGFAVHDGAASQRYHHVSFGQTLVLDAGTADFVAKKQ